MNIYPSSHVATWERWLSNIHDWCISRQLWWGHRIPAYKLYIKDKGPEDDIWIVAKNLEEAHEKVFKQYGLSDRNLYHLEQDEDVLDTWFSSGIYPLACFGWPNATEDLEDFYPLSVMETGSDILFFWVARMAMLCTYLNNNKKPFNDIYLHPMIRDAQGRKMSKSLGNVIDPIDVMNGITLKELQDGVRSNTNIKIEEIERAVKLMEKEFPQGIQECGADALRFTLIKYTQQGRQINMDVQRVVSNRFFCNKIWQATRFAKMNFNELKYQANYQPLDLISKIFTNHSSAFHNQWILVKLNQAISKIREYMDAYHFSEAATVIYDFFLYELCDVYLEWIKPVMKDESRHRNETLDTLHLCLEHSFRLMHPFLPFISEELWQRLPKLENRLESIMLSSYPKIYPQIVERASQVENDMNQLLAVVQEIRSVKQHLQVSAANTEAFVCIHEDENGSNIWRLLNSKKEDMQVLSKIRTVEVVKPETINRMKDMEKRKLAVGVVNKKCSVYLTLPDGYADKLQAELKKLQRKQEQLIQLKQRYEKQIFAPSYESSVPEAVKEKTKEKYAHTVSDLAICEKSIKEMQEFIRQVSN
jgi:valyl-tRNA synthetase